MSGRINHVSVNALDLEDSVEFYVDLLGAERIATPNFGLPVQWLALGRVATPEEVAAAVVFLASPAAEMATGTVLDVNGGSYLRM